MTQAAGAGTWAAWRTPAGGMAVSGRVSCRPGGREAVVRLAFWLQAFVHVRRVGVRGGQDVAVRVVGDGREARCGRHFILDVGGVAPEVTWEKGMDHCTQAPWSLMSTWNDCGQQCSTGSSTGAASHGPLFTRVGRILPIRVKNGLLPESRIGGMIGRSCDVQSGPGSLAPCVYSDWRGRALHEWLQGPWGEGVFLFRDSVVRLLLPKADARRRVER